VLALIWERQPSLVLLFAAARLFCQNLGRTRGDRLDDCHYAFVLLKPLGMEAALASPAITESRWSRLPNWCSGFVIDFMMVFDREEGTCFVLLCLVTGFLHGTGSAKVINLMTT